MMILLLMNKITMMTMMVAAVMHTGIWCIRWR